MESLAAECPHFVFAGPWICEEVFCLKSLNAAKQHSYSHCCALWSDAVVMIMSCQPVYSHSFVSLWRQCYNTIQYNTIQMKTSSFFLWSNFGSNVLAYCHRLVLIKLSTFIRLLAIRNVIIASLSNESVNHFIVILAYDRKLTDSKI